MLTYRQLFIHPMINNYHQQTTTNKLYELKTDTYSYVTSNQKWIASNLTDPKDINKTILSSSEVVVGILFGRSSDSGNGSGYKPLIPSKYFTPGMKYTSCP